MPSASSRDGQHACFFELSIVRGQTIWVESTAPFTPPTRKMLTKKKQGRGLIRNLYANKIPLHSLAGYFNVFTT